MMITSRVLGCCELCKRMNLLKHVRKLLRPSERWLQPHSSRYSYCSVSSSHAVSNEHRKTGGSGFSSKLASGPSFRDFVKNVTAGEKGAPDLQEEEEETHPYLPEDSQIGTGRKGMCGIQSYSVTTRVIQLSEEPSGSYLCAFQRVTNAL